MRSAKYVRVIAAGSTSSLSSLLPLFTTSSANATDSKLVHVKASHLFIITSHLMARRLNPHCVGLKAQSHKPQ